MEAILARVEGKLDLLHAQITTHGVRAEDHEARLRSLEARPVLTPRALITGVTLATTVTGTVVTAFAATVGR